MNATAPGDAFRRPESARESLLDLTNLTVRFASPMGEIHAVEDVSISIGRGDSIGIVGESGSGKTVTCMSMTWLLPSPPARYLSGRVVFNGEELKRSDRRRLREVRGRCIGMVFQNARLSFNPAYRLGSQIAEALRVHHGGRWRDLEPRVIETLRYCNIANPESTLHHFPHEVSGGVAQRVSIALALLIRPQLLIADEPTTALDLISQIEVLSLLERVRRETNTALVLVSHDLNVVRRIADYVIIMYAGRIVEEGPAATILSTPSHPYTIGLLASASQREESGRLYELRGQPPDLSALPAGCSFRSRCPQAFERCGRLPPLYPVTARHFGRCFLLDPRASRD